MGKTAINGVSMEKTETDHLIEHLLPVLTEKEKSDLRSYYLGYEKYEAKITEESMKEFMEHPVFGKLIREIPEDVAEARRNFSRELQRDAILFDKWAPYVNYNLEQGITYAKMGLSFKSWFDVVSLARKYIVPYLEKSYPDKNDFKDAVNGMNLLMDIGMGVIGEAYMRERNEIIDEEQKKIQKLNNELEQKVIERTAQLESVNKELEAFSYSVSHDLRAPLRAVNGYAEMLHDDYGDKMNEDGRRIIDNIGYYANKMGSLIDELLTLSRMGKKELQFSNVNMDELTEGVLISIDKSMKHKAQIKVKDLPVINADYGLIYQAMFNLVSNAVKYSSVKEKPVVEISCEEKKNEFVFKIKDNGVGFDMRYYDKLFGVFQRLHSDEEFEGSGVGLAIVHRLITKHNGKVWAEAKLNEGATFYFSVPK